MSKRPSTIDIITVTLGLVEVMRLEDIMPWLNKPNPNYENKTPLQLMEDGRIDIIHSMIERAKQGTFK